MDLWRTCRYMSAPTQYYLSVKVPPTSTPILNRGCDSVITICVHNIISINPLTHHLRPIVFPQAFRKPQGALSGLNSRPLCLATSTNSDNHRRTCEPDSDALCVPAAAVCAPPSILSRCRPISNRSADRHPIKWRGRRIAARFVSANMYRRTRPDRTAV